MLLFNIFWELLALYFFNYGGHFNAESTDGDETSGHNFEL